MPELPPGLYDTPISEALRRALDELQASMLVGEEPLAADVAPELLARWIHDRLVHALRSLPDKDRLEAQVDLVNRLVDVLRQHGRRSGTESRDRIATPGRRLLSLVPSHAGGLGTPAPPVRPEVPLASSALLVNGRRDLSVGPEIQKELASADRVDLLCSFLKWSGLRVLRDSLAEFLGRRPGALRVLTTAYMGATEARALDELEDLGANIHVSYDTANTRLHAKAWLFHRDSGLSTAIIGSSNLSYAALHDGLEWNVRLSHVDNPAIHAKFEATFEQYWSDLAFEAYDRARFERAVRSEIHEHSALLLAIDVEPRPHQREILESLAAERARGHFRNLVVAATGTGKSIVAALDYKRLRKEWGRASLLFVAHRNEILDQGLTFFRTVLKDATFGERLGDGERPRAGQHVFASIQSLHEGRLLELAPDSYDIVIVDEFHHAKAPTYERLLTHLRPRVLLGLTATPERADGKSILDWFDGRVAAELRLWKALDQGLLSPFQYFGVSDGTDLRDVRWSKGRYDEGQLANLYTASDFWVKRVLEEVRKQIHDPSRMRALGFCVSIDHAEFMAERFARAGLPAGAVSNRSSSSERRAALHALRDGQITTLFSVDLLNEGIDLPTVDTILFLRPTESMTVFLQQLGRGLRRAEDKSCLTVLDFIGHAHHSFRFDQRFRAIIGGTRRDIERAVERGFPSLPAGCSVQLDRIAEEHVLESIRRTLRSGTAGLVEDLRGLGRDVALAEFVRESGAELEEIYAARGKTFTDLRRRAGLPTPEPGRRENDIARSFARLLHVDDPARLDGWRRLLERDAPPIADAGDPLQRMLFVAIGDARRELDELDAAFREIWDCPALRVELQDLLALLDDRRRTPTFADATFPLAVHARYALDEIMAALDVRQKSKDAIQRPREGVIRVERHRADLLFITLRKSEGDYSPTTMYDDYAVSPTRFHWESQSTTAAASKTGQRYIHHRDRGDRILLFVRERRKDARGVTLPYTFLGDARYVSHESERPMRVVWELERAMPAALYQEIKVAAG